jgi:t-SNARE complex subunit (syntaxin)
MVFSSSISGQILNDVQKRKDEMYSLESSLEDLSGLFQSIQELLINQQDQIDIIENHHDDLRGDLEGGEREVKKAVEKRVLSRKRLMVVTGLVILAGIFGCGYLAFHFYCHDSFDLSQDCKF